VLEEAYKIVHASGVGNDYVLLKQGSAPRMKLIEQFKHDTHSVLFGTESFWAGIDVPGESLSCVTIDRIPFPSIGDPLQDYLKENNDRTYFGAYSVPAALLAFRQGIGRLIRTVDDRGVVVMLDSRIVESNYGKKFTRVFQKGTRMVRDIGAIGEFLEQA
jgi:ATP-dependent DNA helicase DinG